MFDTPVERPRGAQSTGLIAARECDDFAAGRNKTGTLPGRRIPHDRVRLTARVRPRRNAGRGIAPALELFRGRLHLVVEKHIILLVQGLVAVEAGGEIGRRVGALVGLEGLVLPFAIADIVRIFRAPARALFHHRVGEEIALDEAAVGVLFGVALGVELGGILDHGDHGPARQRLALLGRVECLRAGVELTELLVVRAVDGGEQHARGMALREGDLVAAGAHGNDDREGGDGGGDGRNSDASGLDGHAMSPPLAAAAPGSRRAAGRGAAPRIYPNPQAAVVKWR